MTTEQIINWLLLIIKMLLLIASAMNLPGGFDA